MFWQWEQHGQSLGGRDECLLQSTVRRQTTPGTGRQRTKEPHSELESRRSVKGRPLLTQPRPSHFPKDRGTSLYPRETYRQTYACASPTLCLLLSETSLRDDCEFQRRVGRARIADCRGSNYISLRWKFSKTTDLEQHKSA